MRIILGLCLFFSLSGMKGAMDRWMVVDTVLPVVSDTSFCKTDTNKIQEELRQMIRSGKLEFNYKNVKSYIFQHLNYPSQAIERDIEGTVIVGFVIMESGKIDSIRVIESVHPILDSAAIQLIQNMPEWKPVYYHGNPVTIPYEVPVVFELNKITE